MVTLELRDSGKELYMRAHYEYRQRLASIDGAYFSHEYKSWIAPIESLPQIESRFAGEIYYKTPLWKLQGKPEPEKRPLSLLGPSPDIPKLSLKPYKYQEDGIRFMIDRLNNVGFCLNGDGVGLGKTLESIGTIKWFVENRGADCGHDGKLAIVVNPW